MKLKLAVIALLTLLWAFAQAQDAPTPPPPAEPPVELSRPALDLVGLAETGATEDAQVTFINNSADAFNLSADGIFYLRDQGISQTVLTAMLNHDKGITTPPPTPAPADDPGASYNYNQQVYPPTTPPANAPSLTENAQSPPPYQPPTDQPPPVYDSSSAPPDVSYFYDSLQPYGSWMVVGGDWCWQPRAVLIDRTWRPYCHGGHWVYSSADWCWQSDYSWGWAPFHYGRWDLRPGVGWVWLPGREWGPGWVTWRTESDHCGWAPLPWHSEFVPGVGFRFNGVGVGVNFGFGLGIGAFTFIGLHDFGARDYYHHSLPRVEAERVYNHSTVINNYAVNNEHILINRGIPKERVEAVTHTTFRPIAIRDEPAHEAGRAAQAGVIYRHELKEPAVQPHIVAQKIDPQHPMVYHPPIGRSSPVAQSVGAARPTGQPQRDFRVAPANPPSTRPNNYNAAPRVSATPTPAATAPRNQSARTYSPPTASVSVASAPSAPSHYTSMNTLVQKQGNPVQNYTPEQPSHVYYPKSYHQANETAVPAYTAPATHVYTPAPSPAAVSAPTHVNAPPPSQPAPSHPAPQSQSHSDQKNPKR